MENGRWRTREAYYSRINKSYFPKVSDELPTRLIIIIIILFHLKTDDSVHKCLPKYHCTFIFILYYVVIRISPVSYLSRPYLVCIVIRPWNERNNFWKLHKSLLEPIILLRIKYLSRKRTCWRSFTDAYRNMCLGIIKKLLLNQGKTAIILS